MFSLKTFPSRALGVVVQPSAWLLACRTSDAGWWSVTLGHVVPLLALNGLLNAIASYRDLAPDWSGGSGGLITAIAAFGLLAELAFLAMINLLAALSMAFCDLYIAERDYRANYRLVALATTPVLIGGAFGHLPGAIGTITLGLGIVGFVVIFYRGVYLVHGIAGRDRWLHVFSTFSALFVFGMFFALAVSHLVAPAFRG